MTRQSLRFFRSIVVLFSLIMLGLLSHRVSGQEKELIDIRPSALAGSWYPGTKGALTDSINGYLRRAEVPHFNGILKALIVPHAGHMYSGPVAAHGYHLLKERPFKRIVLLGPSHRFRFKGVSVNLQTGYETPLGIVPVDREFALKLLDAGPDIRFLKKAHAQEHCLEIQLPFLQTVLDDFKIVPILMGQYTHETCSNLAGILVKLLEKDQDTLLLVSTDLSHYHPYDQAKALDRVFIQDVQNFDPIRLEKDLASGACEACGRGPVITAMIAARALGADRSVILNHANSGDVTGDHSSVVGYVSAALIKSSDTDQHPQ